MLEKRYMKIIIEFNDGISYELDGEQLNPKQIELISHILDIPEMNDCIIGQNK
jgi:hypothetical protein